MPARRALFATFSRKALGLWCHVVALAALGGCGGSIVANSRLREVPADCPSATTGKTTAADAILLEWGGGVTRIYPGDELAGLDLGAFLVSDGTTLADEAESFKESVRTEVTNILCEMPTDGVYLTNNKSNLPAKVTTVYFSQMGSPLGGSQIGQGEYDPCNLDHDNHAIIFGEAILDLGEERTFDEWVLVFANVTAHEIGHMLGYGHVPREIWPASQQPAFVELMMATHTVDEMTRAQRLLSDTSNCPDDHDDAHRSRGVRPVLSCGRE